jgi:uncharacterized protein with gpF-like domain
MKITIEFNDEVEDDMSTHRRMLQAGNMHSALWDIGQHLRTHTKYSNDEVAYPFYEAMREKYYEIMNDNKVDLDD